MADGIRQASDDSHQISAALALLGDSASVEGFASGTSPTRLRLSTTPRQPGDGSKPLFDGVFLGGFECSSHRLENGRRLDLLVSTRHEELADADYARLRKVGISACRDGVPWVRAERSAGCHDFSFATPMLRAARRHGVQVIWDLLHFGWPDHVDVFATSFPGRFARYARAFAHWFANETDASPMVTPINEISFLAWAGGDVRCMNPFEVARGVELKAQLVRATIEAIEAIRAVLPETRFVQPEPIIQIVRHPDQPRTWPRVESDNLLQYQAWDMLSGRVWPGLGGDPKYLDVIGVNFYADNQFMLDGTTIPRGDPSYRPLSAMLMDVARRYGRPLFVSETGSEGHTRGEWLRYVGNECLTALDGGCELHGITLYPIVDHPGWADDRHCENGLWGYADQAGHRPIDQPLLQEIRRLTPELHRARERMWERRSLQAPV